MAKVIFTEENKEVEVKEEEVKVYALLMDGQHFYDENGIRIPSNIFDNLDQHFDLIGSGILRTFDNLDQLKYVNNELYKRYCRYNKSFPKYLQIYPLDAVPGLNTVNLVVDELKTSYFKDKKDKEEKLVKDRQRRKDLAEKRKKAEEEKRKKAAEQKELEEKKLLAKLAKKFDVRQVLQEVG